MNVYLGNTEKVSAVFYGWESDTGVSVAENPASVVVKILNTNTDPDTLMETVSPTSSGSTGGYYYYWTPVTTGNFNVQFVGTFVDGTVSVANSFFHVFEAVTSPASSSSTLREDQELLFAAGFSPMYIDPEEITFLFPSASMVEIAELIHFFSLEVDQLTKTTDTLSIPALEYIRAATACALSRIYDYGGIGEEVSVRLGDLSITNRAYPKNQVTRANASTWCELAAVLRAEVARGQAGMRAVVKGSRLRDPMPITSVRHRRLRRVD